METLSAHSRPEIGISAPGMGKHFEIHSAGTVTSTAVNPATRMPAPPRTDSHDNKVKPQTPASDSPQTREATQSSNISADIEFARPISPAASQDQGGKPDASQPNARLRTPEDQAHASQDAGISPTRHKRTASGLLKAVDSPADPRPRAESVSSSGSKAGEAAAQLKTRLAYAMAKVQHGWEHRNINEVEQLVAASQPRTVASASAVSTPIDMHSPPSKRRSAAGVVSWSLPDSGNTLATYVEVASSQGSTTMGRPSASSPPAQVPATPKTRPPPLRSVTQQAEQDAMDALMLMGGSPGNGGKFPPLSQASSSQTGQASQSQQQTSSTLLSPRRSPQRPASLSRHHSSASELSITASIASEVREARERILDEVEEAA